MCIHTDPHIYIYEEEMDVEPYKEFKCLISIKFSVLM